MNTVEARPEKIRSENGEKSTISGDDADRRDRSKKHKRRPKESSKSKSESHRKSDTSKKSSKKHSSSSKKEKKKKKHSKKRLSSPRDGRPGADRVRGEDAPRATKEKTARRPSSEADADVSSVSSVDSMEGYAQAVVEGFSKEGGGKQKQVKQRSSVGHASRSSDGESLSEDSLEHQGYQKSSASKSRASNTSLQSSNDRHKKEAYKKKYTAHKPSAYSNRPPSTSSPPSDLHNNSNRPLNRPSTVSRNVSSGSRREGPTPTNGRSNPIVPAPRAPNGSQAPVPRTQPTALKPLKPIKSTDDDRHKRELMRELNADQFKTVTRKPATLGRARPPSGGSLTRPLRSGTTPLKTLAATPGTSTLAASGAGPVIYRPPPPPTPPVPPQPTNNETNADTATKEVHKSKNFKFPGFNRKVQKKTK